MNDFESKNVAEDVIREKWTSICNDDGVQFSDRVNGLLTIMAPYYAVLLETQDDLFMRFILEQFRTSKGDKYHEHSWVLHYSEEIPDQHFREFFVKSISSAQANKEIKNWN
jgi:hypothetical protein